MEDRELLALLLLYFRYLVTVNVLWLFLTVSWVGLRSVIVIFPYHTHLLFDSVVIRIGINKMLVRIANRENPDQTAFKEAF